MASHKNDASSGRPPLLYVAAGTLLGIGFFPLAPATLASAILSIVVWFLFKHSVTYIISAALLFIIGLVVSSKLDPFWGEDDRRIVIDEVVGIIISLFFVPQKILFFAIGFLLFRFFDILKPYPVNTCQRLPKGWGVMMDDVVAGIYSNIVLWIFIIIFNRIL